MCSSLLLVNPVVHLIKSYSNTRIFLRDLLSQHAATHSVVFRTEGVDGCFIVAQSPAIAEPNNAGLMRDYNGVARKRHAGQQIAAEVGISPATLLRRLGLDRTWNPPSRCATVSARSRAG